MAHDGSFAERGPAPRGMTRPLAVRWHGRGGYGAKTAAALLAEAVIDAGGYAQAAPEFGPERRGAPVEAVTRLGPGPIHARGPVERPDLLVVLDPRLLRIPATTAGVTARTQALINATRPVDVPGIPAGRVRVVDASGIARRHLGRELPNIPMLAVLVALQTVLDGRAFLAWLEHRLSVEFRPEIVAANLAAAREAMRVVEDAGPAVAARV